MAYASQGPRGVQTCPNESPRATACDALSPVESVQDGTPGRACYRMSFACWHMSEPAHAQSHTPEPESMAMSLHSPLPCRKACASRRRERHSRTKAMKTGYALYRRGAPLLYLIVTAY